MKRTAFVLVFVMIGIGAFAAGTQEPAAPAAGFGATQQGTAQAADGEVTTLTGTYDEIDGYPVLRVDGKTYSAGVPGYRWVDADLEPGDEVRVEGSLFEQSESTDGHIRVSSVEIDGESYDLGAAGYGPGHMSTAGPGYGPQSGYAGRPGYGAQPRGGMHGMRGRGGGWNTPRHGGGWNTPQGNAPQNTPQNAPRQRW